MAERKTVPDLGPLEHQLLRILWRQSPASARDVLDEYNHAADKPLAYTTVMTLLTRMVEKGALEVDRARQPFLFSPAVSREQMLTQRVREFVNQFFDGQAAELAVHLVEEQALPDETIRRLEALIEGHRTRRETSGVAIDASGAEGRP